MKKLFLTAFAVALCTSVFAETFFNADGRPRLHCGTARNQQLVFVPETPGSDNGYWRIEFGGKSKMAELLALRDIPLPAFEKELKIEMDIECPNTAYVVGADLRIKDAANEICVIGGIKRAMRGSFTAVWTITPGAKVKFSWGGKTNRILDLPGKITNLAIALHQPVQCDILLKNVRFIADGKPVTQ